MDIHSLLVIILPSVNFLPSLSIYTVDGERFTELNICGFIAIEVFTETFSCCLGHKCSLFSTIKEKCLYSQKTFVVLQKTVKNTKVYPSESFPVYGIALYGLQFCVQFTCTLQTSPLVTEAIQAVQLVRNFMYHSESVKVSPLLYCILILNSSCTVGSYSVSTISCRT